MLWFFGLPIEVLLGTIWVYYLQIYSVWAFFEMLGGKGDFGLWFWGPYFKGWWSQPIIWTLNIFGSYIPLVNIATSFLFGWWAVAEYYDYNYTLFEGPQPPTLSQAETTTTSS